MPGGLAGRPLRTTRPEGSVGANPRAGGCRSAGVLSGPLRGRRTGRWCGGCPGAATHFEALHAAVKTAPEGGMVRAGPACGVSAVMRILWLPGPVPHRSAATGPTLRCPPGWAQECTVPTWSGMCPESPGGHGPPPGAPMGHTRLMRARVVAAAAVLVSVVSLGALAWVMTRSGFARPAGVGGPAARWIDLVAPIAWTLTGGVLVFLRPRNAVGALVLFAGVCQAVAQACAAYGMYGVGIADPQWPAARWVAFFGAPLWILGWLPLISVLPAIYPDGRLAGPRWRLPVAAAAAGIGLLTVAMLGGYHDIAPGRPPVDVDVPAALQAVFSLVCAALLLGGTFSIWAMSIIRLVRSRPPLRQQLAWLICAVIPLLLLEIAIRWHGLSAIVPIAIAVGVLRYRLLGIEVVLRRGLVYGTLTALVIGVYLAVTAFGGARLGAGSLPGVLAAAVIAIGLSPLRERLQRGVDRVVYGDRGDPMRAITRFGDSVAAEGEQSDLLPSVLITVMSAVHAPGVAIVDCDGQLVARQGRHRDGLSLPLRVSGHDVGTLIIAARSADEPYTVGDRRLLAALVPLVAVVVRALDLTEALERERDRVVTATRAERDRLRRDLHDALGGSLSGIGLGLQALDTALVDGDQPASAELLARLRSETTAAVMEIRRILDDLRPASLDDASLAAAMRQHADAIGSEVRVELDLAALPALPPHVETAAYRIAQEALTNAVKHACADNARLTLNSDEQRLRVEVTDDGHGFEPAATRGLGLASMRHRAETLGGTLDVSTGDHGTSVVASLPLNSSP